jgi:putative endonuclease
MSANQKQKIGQKGEDLAAEYLSAQGYQVLVRNYRNQTGEIDLICLDGNEIVFVEVKTRTNQNFGTPEMAVDQNKLKKIIEVGFQYLGETNNESCAWRVDVIAILLSAGELPETTHYKGIRIYE